MKGDALIWAAGAAIFSAYLLTLSPSIAGGDSGEIVAEGCELGVAHPPGYPLLTVLIHAISEFSPDTFPVAYYVNAMSAALTTLAAILLGYTIRLLSPKGVGVFGAVLGMGLFSFSPLIWQYAVTAEVFPLNTMFAAWIVYLVVDFSQHRKISTAYFGAFICGIAGCNQHTIILYEVPLILWMLVLLKDQILQQPMILIYLGVSFLSGLLPYLYMPLSELFNPRPGAWGHVTTFSGFLHHFLRRDYGTFQLFSGSTSRRNENLWERHAAYIKDITTVQSPFFIQYIALIGIVVSVLYGTGILNTLLGIETASKQGSNGNSKSESLLWSGKKGKRGGKNDVTSAVKVKAKQAASASVPQSTTTPENVEKVDDGGEPVSVSPWTHWTPLALVLTQIFYFSFFHTLANLPLSDRLLYGVHQRFWMQPNILYFCWVGIGCNTLVSLALQMSAKLAHSSALQQQVGAVSLQCVALCLVGMCVHQQWSTSLPMADQSDQRYFQQYAQAVLAPISPKAIFMINYDQQWTSVRYMQVCEGFQPQVVSMHMSLMTYPWFYFKRELYANQNNMSFPGTYLTSTNAPNAARKIQEDHAFTMKQFLDANIPRHRVYVGGKFTHGDAEVAKHYDLIPVGLVSQISPITRLPNAVQYSHMCIAGWERVLSFLPKLPNLQKYQEETWEWTIGRDVKDRLGDSAAYLLELTIKEADKEKEKEKNGEKQKKKEKRADVTDEEHELLVQPLVDAAYWLETAFAYETQLQNHQSHPFLEAMFPKPLTPMNAPASLLKNLGLVHVHLLQDSRLSVYVTLPAMTKDIFNSSQIIAWPTNERWREWSADRFMYYWGLFLQKPEARDDPQFKLISNLYNQVKDKASGATASSASAETPAAPTAASSTKKPKSKSKARNAQQIDPSGNIVS